VEKGLLLLILLFTKVYQIKTGKNTFLVSTKSRHFNFCPNKKSIYRVPVKYKKLCMGNMIQLLESSIIKYDSCRALWHRLMHTPSGKKLVTVDIAIYKSLSNSGKIHS
jgi:hypothetical protein